MPRADKKHKHHSSQPELFSQAPKVQIPGLGECREVDWVSFETNISNVVRVWGFPSILIDSPYGVVISFQGTASTDHTLILKTRDLPLVKTLIHRGSHLVE